MFKSKIFTIFVVLFLAQAAFGKSLDTSNAVDSSEETPKKRIATFVTVSFIDLFQEYYEKCIKISREILKDEDFLNHHEPMVEEFKRNLTKFLESNEAKENIEKMLDIDYYYEIPEDKLTPESKYILEVMNKYHYKDIEVEMDKKFVPIAENFMKVFEEYKKDLDKPMLDWYEKYQHIEDLEKKIEALIELLKIAGN